MAKNTGKHSSQDDEQSIIGPVSPQAISEELGIMRYVEKETQDEKIKSLEKVKTEQVFDTRMEIWNVRTEKNEYWVITNPLNIYLQSLYPSFDYALTFHIGLTYRHASNSRTEIAEKEQDQLAVPWRHWEHATVALDKAEEVEEFQAVGILCRECLLSCIKSVISNGIAPVGQDHPKTVDFFHWLDHIVNSIASESRDEEIRSYLKTISKAAWKYVNWLTHATNATRFDGNVGIEATEYVLMAFGAALTRYESRNH